MQKRRQVLCQIRQLRKVVNKRTTKYYVLNCDMLPAPDSATSGKDSEKKVSHERAFCDNLGYDASKILVVVSWKSYRLLIPDDSLTKNIEGQQYATH